MKLIDRYLLRTFLQPLIYCLLAFTMVYVIYDLFDNLPDFVEGKTPLPLVTRYYLILMPSVLVRIVPISMLCAVVYSLYSLTKNNELTAMRASGISLERLMLPFVGVGLLVSLGVAAVHETLGPSAAYWCYKFVKEQGREDPDAVHRAQLAFKKEDARRFWLINQFDTRDYSMRGIEVIQRREDGGSELSKLTAVSGRWVDGHWWFQEVREQRYDEEGNPMGAAHYFENREMSEYTEQPKDFLNEVKDPEFLSSMELIAYLDTHRHLQRESIARLTVDLHHRLSLPWASLIVTLLGIPFGAQTGRKGAFQGIAFSFLLFFTYYALIHVGLTLGKESVVAPWLGGWLPNIFFLVTGLILLHRMR